MRPRSASLLALLLAILIIPLPSAAEEVEYTFDGGGWGHSIGMSQYGAYGMALDGLDAEAILSHYYSGTADVNGNPLEFLADIDAGSESTEVDRLYASDVPLWVGFAQNRTRLTFKAIDGSLEICQDGGTCPVATVPKGEVWTIEGDGVTCGVFDAASIEVSSGPCKAAITWDAGTSIQLARSYPLVSSDPKYGRGEIKIRDNRDDEASEPATRFHVIVALNLEEYLHGLGEMPSSWDRDALEAQAIAGRSYAAYKYLTRERSDLRQLESIPDYDAALSPSRRAECWCHLYDSPAKDQNYVGLGKETAPSGSQWVAAVVDTEDEVVTYRGSGSSFPVTKLGVVQAFYFSSSAGTTESNTDLWGPDEWPYLIPVPDPWSQSPAVENVYDFWNDPNDPEAKFPFKPVVTAAQFAAELGWDSVSDVELVKGPPGLVVRLMGVYDGEAVVAEHGRAWLYYNFSGFHSAQITAINGVGPPGPFTDIDGSTHAANILIIWQAGVTEGCAPGLYCPSGLVTRGQMASFLARSLELPEPTIDFFEDDDGSTHEDNINRVAEAGIATGFADGTYRPQDPVRRDHMATFMARALGLEPVAGTVFTDVFGFHEGNINALAAAGVTEGCDDEGPRFCPAEFVTRGQMASFLARAFFIP